MKKSCLLTFTLLTICFFNQGCNVAANSNSSSFSYNLTENGCSTGEKTFSSNDAMCAALKDDARNNYCAQTLRYQKFMSECPGHTW